MTCGLDVAVLAGGGCRQTGPVAGCSERGPPPSAFLPPSLVHPANIYWALTVCQALRWAFGEIV